MDNNNTSNNEEMDTYTNDSGFIAKEYENLIPCEICNTLVNFEDYNDHINNCSNPFNSLFSSNLSSLDNPIFNSFMNISQSPQVIFLPMQNQSNNVNENNVENENNLENEDNSDDNNDENNPEIEINIIDSDDESLDDNENVNENLGNPNLPLQNILNNLVQNILNNNDYNINFEFNNDSYEELTNLGETIGDVEIGIKDVTKVCKKIDEKLTCPICISEFDNGVVTTCNHKFCQDCLYKWLETNIKCPYCFVELNEN